MTFWNLILGSELWVSKRML